jgi:hypothetical protein
MTVTIRIPDELKERIDSHRPATVSREAWVRAACERALPPLRPDVGKLIDTATGHETPVRRPPTKQELDLQRQQKLNVKKGATKR